MQPWWTRGLCQKHFRKSYRSQTFRKYCIYKWTEFFLLAKNVLCDHVILNGTSSQLYDYKGCTRSAYSLSIVIDLLYFPHRSVRSRKQQQGSSVNESESVSQSVTQTPQTDQTLSDLSFTSTASDASLISSLLDQSTLRPSSRTHTYSGQ